MAEYALDWAEYAVKAGLLLYLCKDSIMVKEKYRSTGKVLFFIQALLIGYWLSHSAWVDRMLYGNEDGMINNSSYSIIKLTVTFCCSFLVVDIFYCGRKLAKLYLLLVFYTVQEMSRFIWHSIWSLMLHWCIDRLNAEIIAQTLETERFFILIEYLQFFSFLLFAVGYLALMFAVFKIYKRYLAKQVDEIGRQGLWFLMLTPVIGMVFDVLWRISFYYQEGAKIEFMYDRHGSMYVVVPVFAALCLICIVMSRKIYSDLMRSEEQKNSLLFYRQQLSDMTAHVRELEQLYDGIRGMRHDINNYVADMEQLLFISGEGEQLSEEVRQEAGQYLQNMQSAAQRLTMRFATGNPVTDVILNRKWQMCEQGHIVLSGDLLYPSCLGIEVFDLGILLNNALDNAIEACKKLGIDEKKEIMFRGYVKGRMFFLEIKNTCNTIPGTKEGGMLQTTKQDEWRHGLGMSNMKSCVEKYYGTMQFETADGLFSLTIMLQGMKGD